MHFKNSLIDKTCVSTLKLEEQHIFPYLNSLWGKMHIRVPYYTMRYYKIIAPIYKLVFS